MTDKDIVLSVKGISKNYHGKSGGAENVFWALKDISFNLRKGEILGIIGHNGAGKSTLLKIMSEIIPPSEGIIEYEGNLLPILEVGTGFHPDLSGYENIFLNASILGMKKKEVQARLDDIIDFSGIRESIHEPVKNYSSGMYLRLALSIALFTNNEILLLDEVISVGDMEFRMKAIERLREEAKKGKACIMISHDLNSIMQLCDNCVLLEHGRIKYYGKANATITDYFEDVYQKVDVNAQVLEHTKCKLISIETTKEEYYPDEEVTINVNYEVFEEEGLRVVVRIKQYQTPILMDSLAFRPDFKVSVLKPGIYQTACRIPADLLNKGNYLISLILGNETEAYISVESMAKFAIKLRDWEINKIWNTSNVVYPVRAHCLWETRENQGQ